VLRTTQTPQFEIRSLWCFQFESFPSRIRDIARAMLAGRNHTHDIDHAAPGGSGEQHSERVIFPARFFMTLAL
jgi:hypothetical protein